MRNSGSFAILLLAAWPTGPALAESMAMDRPVQVNGLETVCTGVGETKDDPQWLSYPVRIEFSNGGAQYLSGATVRISRGVESVGSLDCPGAWVLLRGAPGEYRVDVTIDNSSARAVNASFHMGSGPQKRIVLRFPDFQPNQ
jgi:hypothetical protein